MSKTIYDLTAEERYKSLVDNFENESVEFDKEVDDLSMKELRRVLRCVALHPIKEVPLYSPKEETIAARGKRLKDIVLHMTIEVINNDAAEAAKGENNG